MRPGDTTPEAWKVQIEIMRRKGPEERFLIACRMSDDLYSWEHARSAAEIRPTPSHPA